MTNGTEEDDGDGQFLADHPWLVSAGIGAGTFLVEYVAVALFFVVGPSSTEVDGVRDTVVTYGHVLYNAHNVPTKTVVQNATATGTANTNALYGATGASVPPIVYFLIPVVALLVAGAVVGRERASPLGTSTVKLSADNAGELTLGYLAVALVGTFVFVRSAAAQGMTGTLSPNLPFTFGAFLLYPIVFGFVGSLVYLKWERRQS